MRSISLRRWFMAACISRPSIAWPRNARAIPCKPRPWCTRWVYLGLLDSAQPSWQDRAHFFAVCACMMRRILVNWALVPARLLKLAGAACPRWSFRR